MIDSFYILAMLAVVRVWVEVDLVYKFSFLEKVIPYLNYGLIGAVGLFVLFTVITLLGKLFRGSK